MLKIFRNKNIYKNGIHHFMWKKCVLELTEQFNSLSNYNG